MGDRPISDSAPRPHRNHDVALCLGENDDIITPLTLAPNVDVLFMVGQYSEEQIDVMLDTLKNGKRAAKVDQRLERRFSTMPILEKTTQHYLPKGKAELLMYARYPERPISMPWNRRIRFRYDGKERVMFFFNQSGYDKWPACVTNLSHVFVMGGMMNMHLMTTLLHWWDFSFVSRMCGAYNGETRFYTNYDSCACKEYFVVKNGDNQRGNIFGCYTMTVRTNVHVEFEACSLTLDRRDCELHVLDTGRIYRTRWIRKPKGDV